jgi:hypothetical protein
MFLPSEDWTINANGWIGTLHVAGVDPQGNVTGSLTFAGEAPNQLNNIAFWDEASKKISFIRAIDPAGPSQLADSFEAF